MYTESQEGQAVQVVQAARKVLLQVQVRVKRLCLPRSAQVRARAWEPLLQQDIAIAVNVPEPMPEDLQAAVLCLKQTIL